MALDMDRTIRGGLLVSGAYHKINYISGNKNTMDISVYVYKDAATCVANPNDFCDQISYQMQAADMDFAVSSPWGGNSIKQAYDYLASLAEYSSAVSS